MVFFWISKRNVGCDGNVCSDGSVGVLVMFTIENVLVMFIFARCVWAICLRCLGCVWAIWWRCGGFVFAMLWRCCDDEVVMFCDI